MNTNDEQLIRELEAIGFHNCEVKDGKVVSHVGFFDTDTLKLALLAHKNDVFGIDGLQKSLCEAAWARYCSVRNEAIRVARQKRYVKEADPLKAEAERLTMQDLDSQAHQVVGQWCQAREHIQQELPYVE